GVGAAADVPRGRSDDIAALGPHIDAGAERRIVHVLGGEARDLDAVRRREHDVLATAAGEHPPRRRNLVLAFERSEAFVAAMARVDIDDHQLLGGHAEVGFGYAQAKQQFDVVGIGGGGVNAVRGISTVRMLRGLFAAQPAAGAHRLAVVGERPPQWKNSVVPFRPGERGCEDGGVAHACPRCSCAPSTNLSHPPSARAFAIARLRRIAAPWVNSCKVSGTSKHGDIAANAARQETSASQVSPARSITVLVPGKIDTSVMASRISRISARLKLSSYSRPVWENST